MSAEEGSGNIPMGIRDKYKDVRYYNVKKHERGIIILMMVVIAEDNAVRIDGK